MWIEHNPHMVAYDQNPLQKQSNGAIGLKPTILQT